MCICVCEGQSKGPLGMAETYHNFERGASLAGTLRLQTQNPLGKVCSFTREKEWKFALGTSFRDLALGGQEFSRCLGAPVQPLCHSLETGNPQLPSAASPTTPVSQSCARDSPFPRLEKWTCWWLSRPLDLRSLVHPHPRRGPPPLGPFPLCCALRRREMPAEA